MASLFQRATKTQARLRLALCGIAGAGKTYSALRIAKALGGPVAVIDTEHGSASKYAGLFDFDTLQLTSYHPERYVEAIKDAGANGYSVLIIDSLSHAWNGTDGALELVDMAAKRSRSGNSFTAWRDVTPLHNKMIEAILACKCHVIATMRSKPHYDLEENNGKKTPKRVGLQPIQREGVEHEFDLVGDLDQDHTLIITKSRCPQLSNAVLREPGEDLAATLKAWLTDGAPMPEHSPMPPPNANGPQGKLRKPDPDPEIPFGPAKGKRLSQLSLKETRTYIQITEGQLAKPGDQYADANTRRLRLLQEHERKLLEAEEDEIRHAEESHAPA